MSLLSAIAVTPRPGRRSGGSVPPPPDDDTGTGGGGSGGGGGGSGGAGEIHLFVVAGQSNATGLARDDGGAVFPEGTLDFGPDGWGPVGSRLYHGPWEEDFTIMRPDPDATFGFARQFAIDHAAAHPGVTLAFVGVADGATGFGDGHWNPGDGRYAAAVARINAAMAARPAGAELKGILWMQGERDGTDGAWRAAYAEALAAFVPAFRADIDGADDTTPFVAGGLFRLGARFQTGIQRVIQSLPNTIAFTGYADPSVPAEPGAEPDGVHLAAVGQRQFGTAYLAAFGAARDNGALARTGSASVGAVAYRDAGGSTSETIAALDIGTPAPDRVVVVALHTRGSYNTRPLSVTLAGRPMHLVVGGSTGSNVAGVSLFHAHVPEGATADLELRYSASPRGDQHGVSAIAVYGTRLHPAGPRGWDAAGASSGTTLSMTVDVRAGDVVLGAATLLAAPSPLGAVFDLSGPAAANDLGKNCAGVLAAEVVPADAAGRPVTVTSDVGVNSARAQVLVLRPT